MSTITFDTLKKDIAEVKTTLQVLDAKFEKMTWMLGAVLALAAANFAKQYF
jgi:hypothetical protein